MYKIKFEDKAKKQMSKLENYTQKQIQTYINRYINNSANPRQVGKALQGSLKGLWRYDIGKYRLICHIQDEKLTVLAVKIGHRKDIYQQ